MPKRNSWLIYGTLVVGVAGVVSMVLADTFWLRLLRAEDNREPYNIAFQFWLLVVLGGGISFAHQWFIRTREEKEQERERDRARKDEEKRILLDTGNDLLAAYNRAKRVRRILRARVLRIADASPDGEGPSIGLEDYDEQMAKLIDAHLEFEAIERRVRAHWFLIEGARYADLRHALDSIRAYLQSAIEEYEEARSRFTAESERAPLGGLEALGEFLGGEGIGPEYWTEFKLPFRTALRCLRMEVLSRSPIEPPEVQPPSEPSQGIDERVLGRPEGEVGIISYRGEWPELFREAAAQLDSAFRGAFTSIEHIGSTAVPGLAAEPVLDLLAEVESLAEAQPLISELVKLEYERDPDEADHPVSEGWLFRRVQQGRCTHQLWVVEGGSEFGQFAIALRDHLRRHPGALKAFMTEKRQLVQRYPDDHGAYVAAVWELARGTLGWQSDDGDREDRRQGPGRA